MLKRAENGHGLHGKTTRENRAALGKPCGEAQGTLLLFLAVARVDFQADVGDGDEVGEVLDVGG